jgi:hypothetical protein
MMMSHGGIVVLGQLKQEKIMIRYKPFPRAALCVVVLGFAASCVAETDLQQPDVANPEGAALLRAFSLANGNELRFYQFDHSSVGVLEIGQPDTNAIGSVPALQAATPYELFLAVAAEDDDVPPVLLAAHEAVLAEEGPRDTIRVRLNEIDGFFAARKSGTAAHKFFTNCTNEAAWGGHIGSSPIGSNCPGSAGKAFYECISNWLPPMLDDAVSQSRLGGYRNMRASLCARSGPGTLHFLLRNRIHPAGAWSILINESLNTGGYFYWWYRGTTPRDYSRFIYRSSSASKRANKSWWGRY